MTTEQFQLLDKQYVWHPFTHMSLWLEDDPLVITHGEGLYLVDSDGNRYLDAISSLWCNVHGHRVKEIDDAIINQLGKIAHTTQLGLANDQAAILAEKLIQIAPKGLAKVFYSDSGATATEIAFKMAAQYWWNIGRPQKHEFIGLTEAYHGDTVGAMSVGMTSAFHKPYKPLLFPVHYSPAPFPYRYPVDGNCLAHALNAMETILKQHNHSIAAICLEPLVMGAAGMIVHPDGFLRGVRRLADEYHVLLICDEVATGFGRTGKMFACEHENVSPDILCIAKGITGGYLPLAATLATDKIFKSFLGKPHEGKTFFHGHTYTGNPLACAAAIASIDLIEKNHLLTAAQDRSNYLSSKLQKLLDLPNVGDIRQKGLMVGIELVADKPSKQPFDPKARVGATVCRKIRDQGIILRPLGDTIVIFPPLTIENQQIDQIVDALDEELSHLDQLPAVPIRGDDQIAGDF